MADVVSIRVVIVDDDPFVCESLSTILSVQSDISVCATGRSGKEAIELFAEHHPDILLMDIQMPEMDGLEAAKRILKQQNGTVRIVFLTTFSDDEYIVSALRMGAKGYLIKQEVATIVPALRSVMSGQNVLGSEVLDKVDALMRKPEKVAGGLKEQAIRKYHLSEREMEIIELIAQGFDNKEISSTIYIGEGTVRNHVSAILQKLDMKNRTQLAVFYYQSLI